MRRIVIALVMLAAVFYCASSFGQEEVYSKKVNIKAQVGTGEVQTLGSVTVTSPKSSLKIMCEDENGNAISTFIIPSFVDESETAKK